MPIAASSLNGLNQSRRFGAKDRTLEEQVDIVVELEVKNDVIRTCHTTGFILALNIE